jgi:fluoroquinolone resistance protein
MTIGALAQQIGAGKPVSSLRISDDRWPELDG